MERSIIANKSYRYEILQGSEDSNTILYVLHGYGQLAKYFIRKFESYTNLTIVAPEGMHRFYLNGSSGRVGASWMTKEARELDIADNVNWLNELHKELTKEKKFKKIWLLGFSQGGATAARWKELGEVSFDAMILWACVYPPDLENVVTKGRSSSYFVLGSEDEYYSGESADEITDFYRENGFEIIQYGGKHDIDKATLTDILLTL